MIDSIFMANLRGDRLVERYYRGKSSKQVIRAFRHHYIAPKRLNKPVIAIDQTYFFHIKVDDIYLGASSMENCNPALVFQFLYALADLFKSYFGKVSPTSIRDNFVLVYELLDECMDNGYPQITSIAVLKEFIKLGSSSGYQGAEKESKLKGKLTKTITGVNEWRPDKGIQYEKNEVFIDVFESVNLLLSTQGAILRSDVTGQVIMKTRLSGMPSCKFGLNDRMRINKEKEAGKLKRPTKGIAIDDVTFHRCVRLSRFDQDRTINFVPPDGEFELMKYRVTNDVNLPFKIIAVINERGRNRVEYDVKVAPTFGTNGDKLIANNVVIKIPVPENATAKQKAIKIKSGKAKYYPTHNAIVWKFKRFMGSARAGYRLQAEVNRVHSVNDAKWVRPPITMQFQVPMFTASGLHVRFLKIIENSGYQTVKWVRYITKAGSFQIRI